MSKKVFGWVQPHYRQGSKAFNNYYLPYAAGILWTYLQQFDYIRDKYELGEVVYKRDPVDEVVEKLKNCSVVGFSTYVWNKNYNFEVARRLKELNPDCLILFGGPETPHTRKNIFKNQPFIDIICKLEGELVLKDIIDAIEFNRDLRTVPGIVFNDNGEPVDTGDSERIHDLDAVPSPYLTGFFDKLIADNPDKSWSVVFEPDRGCPYQCTYCDWGSVTYSKIKKFDTQRLFDEIEWFGKNKIKMIMIANANFGIFPERDNLIADKIVETQQKYGHPVSGYVSWAKNQKAQVVNIAKKLENLTGLTVSLQTMTDDVLEAVKRDNLPINKTEEIFQLCHLKNVPVHTELILGLPGESLESWKETLYKLFKAGNHTSVSFYTAQILENSEMNLVQRKLYNIQSIPVADFLAGREMEEEIHEYVNAIVSTKHLPHDDMLKAHLFNTYINCFHVHGITTYIAKMMYKLKGEEYSTFYDKLYDFLMQDPWFNNEIAEVKGYYEKWMNTGAIQHPNIRETIEISGLNLHYRPIINLYCDKERLRPHVFGLVRQFVDNNYELDKEFVDELFRFQELYFMDFDKRTTYPQTVEFEYDFVNYFLLDVPLKNKVQYQFEYRGFINDTLEIFCELIYYARRRQVTKAKITTIGQTAFDSTA